MELIKVCLKSETTLMSILKKQNLFIFSNNKNIDNFNFKHNTTNIKSKLEEFFKSIGNQDLKIVNNENSESTNKNENSLKIFLDYPIFNNQIKNDNNYNYDQRIFIGQNDDENKIVERIIEALFRDQEYISTRGSTSKISKQNEDKVPYLFYDVIRDGLAKDKGLFMPKYFLKFDFSQWERFINMNYEERCLTILENFAIGELNPQKLKKMIKESYATFTNEKVLPILKLEENQFIMEEYYGPSASFKDLALQLFPRLFQESISNFNEKIAILVATSGDTGSAVLSGFKEIGIPVIVLYPEGKVSQIQAVQMTTAEGNVKVFAVKADFDFCQNTVKDIFNDNIFTQNLKEKYNLNLTSANSINWGRLFPQILYSIHSYFELVKQDVIKMGATIDVCIPSGNFGNILGSFIAKKMGLPIDKLICASNENKILTDFLNTGEFDLRTRSLKPTKSPAIDILIPSNIERLLYILTNDASTVKNYFDDLSKNKYFKVDENILNLLKNDFIADFCSEEEASKTIKDVFSRTGYILDPHTAVAKNIADRYRRENKICIIAATAHYAKFPETVMQALNIPQSDNLGDTIERLKQIETKSTFHKHLEDIINKKVLHEEVFEADIDFIKKRIFEVSKEMI